MDLNEYNFPTQDESPRQIERWLRIATRVGKFCLLLMVVPAVILIYRQPLERQNSMRAELERIKLRRDELLAQRDQLKRQCDWIRHDPDYLEVRARDRENMHKKGEFVIRFE